MARAGHPCTARSTAAGDVTSVEITTALRVAVSMLKFCGAVRVHFPHPMHFAGSTAKRSLRCISTAAGVIVSDADVSAGTAAGDVDSEPPHPVSTLAPMHPATAHIIVRRVVIYIQYTMPHRFCTTRAHAAGSSFFSKKMLQ